MTALMINLVWHLVMMTLDWLLLNALVHSIHISKKFVSMYHCTDIDECAENTDNCSQNCTDTLGSYLCVCLDGYTLDPDQHTCNGLYGVLINDRDSLVFL